MIYTFISEDRGDIKHFTEEVFVIKCLDNQKYYQFNRGFEQNWTLEISQATEYSEYDQALEAITEQIEVDGNYFIEKIFQKKINYTD